jgi:hypothetical protein
MSDLALSPDLVLLQALHCVPLTPFLLVLY